MACGQEQTSAKARLSKLHCPFTWEMLDSTTKHVTYASNYFNYDEMDDFTSCPLENLIKSLFECYKAVLSADKKVETKIKNAEELLMQIQQEEGSHQIIRAIEHVFYATKCFFLYEAERMDELEEILANIVDIENFNETERGALYGCQSIVWSCLNDFGMSRALDAAKQAVYMNQDCALWHYIFAKNLRRQRRLLDFSSDVSDMEEQHFQLAYALSKTNVFGIYMLQMRMEKFHKYNRDREYVMKKNTNEKEVLEIAKQILDRKPDNFKILLRLALMFLRVRNSDELSYAQRCLDAVKELAPGNSTYLHYTGMMYEQCGEYREALEYYKRAADYNNIIAELAYVQYGWETGVVEPLPHLLRMLKKYNQSVKERQITILTSIAVAYYCLYKDITSAAEYFLKALIIDSRSKKFKVFYKFLDFSTRSISIFLKNHFLPEAANHQIRNAALKRTCEKIKQFINLGGNDIADVTEEFKNVSMNSENLHGSSTSLNRD